MVDKTLADKCSLNSPNFQSKISKNIYYIEKYKDKEQSVITKKLKQAEFTEEKSKKVPWEELTVSVELTVAVPPEPGRDLVELSEYTIPIGSLRVVGDSYIRIGDLEIKDL